MDLHIETGDPFRLEFHRASTLTLQDLRPNCVVVEAKQSGGDMVRLFLEPGAAQSLAKQLTTLFPVAPPAAFDPSSPCAGIRQYLTAAYGTMSDTEKLAAAVLERACRGAVHP